MSFILSLLSFMIIGASFVLLVVRRDRYNYSLPELAALSFFLGVGFASYQLFLYYLFGIAFSFLNLIIVPVVLFILVFSRYASKPERVNELLPDISGFQRWNRTEHLLAAGLLIQFLWAVFLVAPMPVSSHDAVANYALKAKIFYFTGGIPEGFFGFSETTVAHPDYPLLLPFLMTWIYNFIGFNDLAVNMVMPVIYLAFMVLVYSQMKKLFGRQYSLLSVFILATIPQLVDYATIIHADLILAAFVTCATLYFISYIRTGDRMRLVFCSLLFGFSLWIKNEAMVFTGAFIAVFAVFIAKSGAYVRKQKLGDMIVSFAIITAVSAPWFAVKISSAALNTDIVFSRLTPEYLWQNIKDIPILLNLFQQEVFGPKKWNIFWIMFFAGMIWKRKRLREDECFYMMIFLVLSAAGYFAGYMATTSYDLFYVVNTTISRFMLHFCGIALLILAFLMHDDVREIASFSTGGYGER